MTFHRPREYHGHDAYREPLHPSDSGFYQHDQESQTEATSYLPPQNLDPQSSRATHSPRAYNNVEFSRISEMVLEKRSQISDTSMSANQLLNQYLNSVERARFSASVAERFNSLSMFPSVDEREMDKLVRKLEIAFGKAALMSIPDRSNDNDLNHHQMQQYQQPYPSRNSRQYHEQRFYDTSQGVRRDSQMQYSSPRTDDSGYNRKIYQAQEGTPSLNLTASPREERRNPRHYERQGSRSNTLSSRQDLQQHSISEASLSSPISDSRYKNTTYRMREGFPSRNIAASPRGGQRTLSHYERQSSFDSNASSRQDFSLSPRGVSNTIAIREIEETSPRGANNMRQTSRVYNVTTSPRGEKRTPNHYERQSSHSSNASSKRDLSLSPRGKSTIIPIVEMEPTSPKQTNPFAVLKKQDAMKNALMQEIGATAEMLGTISPRSKDYKVYSKHLYELQGKLKEMEETTTELPFLDIDQVFEPATGVSLGSGSAIEMDEIMPPRSPHKSTQSKDISAKDQCPRTNEEFKTASGKRDQNKQTNKNGIPNDITFDKDRTCKDSMTLDTAGFDAEQKESSSSVLKVVAPADLQEGYDLQVIYEGKAMSVQVPKGGVSKGETFESIMSNPRTSGEQAEPGRWKGSLFGCLAFGIDHPLFFHSCFCPQIALTQIMARMNLSNYGERNATSEKRRGVTTILLLSVGLLILNALLICSMIFIGDILVNIFSAVIFTLLNVPTLLSFCHVAVQTRRATRIAYNIPEQHCVGCEDLLVSVWCSSCSIAQIMRHTADYSTYRAVWFSETGLPDHVVTELPSRKSGTLV